MATCKAFFFLFRFFQNKNLVNKLKAVEDLAAAREHHLTEMVRQARQRLSFTENNMAALIRTMAPFKQRVIICLLLLESSTHRLTNQTALLLSLSVDSRGFL